MSSTPGRDKRSTDQEPVHGVTIWLDTYDEIFSDFDPRDYEARALSDDFLAELRKLVRETDEKEALREFQLLIPAKVRNTETEHIISQRLHSYFRKAAQRITEERKKIKIKGILFSLLGLLFLLIAGYISFTNPSVAVFHFIMIALEPAGWFFTWTGFDHLANLAHKRPEIEFNLRMSKNKITFRSL